jgi:hypothetical protein
MSSDKERERQRQKAASKAAAERDIPLRDVVNPDRRASCEHDDSLWLRTYLPSVFYHDFTSDQLAIIRDIGTALRYGTNKCIAAPRGDGKSSITRYLILKYALYRQIRFGLIVCATGGKADEALRSIKAQLRRKNSPLWEDFPLECDVASYVAPAPARANNATVDGRRIHVEWSASRMILPTFLEDEPTGPIVMSHGWESEQLQGCNVLDVRPDFVMLDDLDNRGSLAAEEGVVAGKVEEIIDKTIGGLGGPGRRLGQVMLCTITSPRSAAFKYSDPAQKPAWSGIRLPRIKAWPERLDLWETYQELRQSGQNTRVDPQDASSPAQDPFGREAFHFLESNFDEMHRGAVLSNEYDYITDPLPDGTPTHLSALQKCYDFICDRGMNAFLTEHQNAPPPIEDEVSKVGITREIVQSRLSGFDRNELPPGEIKITAGIDLGKHSCHWAAGAFRDGGAGCILNYGIIEVHGTEATEQAEVIQRALLRALTSWKEMMSADPFRDAESNPVPLSCVLIDSGYFPDAAYEFVRMSGEPFRAAKGSSRFHHGTRGVTRRVGNHWFAQPQASKVWLYTLDADHWKRSVHDQFMAEPRNEDNRPNPGSLTLFVPLGNRNHKTFSAHILAEEWVTEFVPKKGERSKWLKHSGNNHFLDATSLMLAAAEMSDVGIFARAQRTKTSDRPTAAQLAGRS